MTEKPQPDLPDNLRARQRLNEILLRAAKDRASDIHFEPSEGGGGRIRCRIDGAMHDLPPIPPEEFPALMDRIKAMANLDLAQRNVPQDGRVILTMNAKPYDLWLSTVPVVDGERVTIRILDRQTVILSLDNLKMPPASLAAIRALCRLPQGLVICAGPAGSGKTTLLYSMLMEIDREKSTVFSIEDPVEYKLPGVSQIQIRPQHGLTFPRAMRAVLRQDPDVLMVGEIRDPETAQVAVQTVLVGHLVFTTLHTNTAPQTVRRLIDVGVEPFVANAALAGVVAQRLVRVLCDQCKRPAALNEAVLPPEAVALLRATPGATFHTAAGCPACNQTGYRGRRAIHEILVMTDAIRTAVAAGADPAALRAAARESGMRTLLEDGLARAAEGVTSVEEVLRVVPLAS